MLLNCVFPMMGQRSYTLNRTTVGVDMLLEIHKVNWIDDISGKTNIVDFECLGNYRPISQWERLVYNGRIPNF